MSRCLHLPLPPPLLLLKSSSHRSASRSRSPHNRGEQCESGTSRINHFLWGCWVLFLKSFVLFACLYSFLLFYKVKMKKGKDFLKLNEEEYESWSTLPVLSSLSLYEIPYTFLLYTYYFGSFFQIKPLYTPAQTPEWFIEYLIYILYYAAALGIMTVIWTLIGVIAASLKQLCTAPPTRNACFRFFSKLAWFTRLIGKLTKWFVITTTSVAMFCACVLPFTNALSQSTQHALPYPSVLQHSFAHLSSFHLTNSYGLFRSMTGMGPDQQVTATGSGEKWGVYDDSTPA